MEQLVLQVARAIRRAEIARVAASVGALTRYDETLHNRGEAAASYLRCVKRADDAYDAQVAAALAEHQERLLAVLKQ